MPRRSCGWSRPDFSTASTYALSSDFSDSSSVRRDIRATVLYTRSERLRRRGFPKRRESCCARLYPTRPSLHAVESKVRCGQSPSHTLEAQVQSEAQLSFVACSGGPCRAGDHHEVPSGDLRRRSAEVRGIGEIEGFRAELQLEELAEIETAEQAQVGIHYARSAQN